MAGDEFNAEDLRAWQKDERGKPFWAEINRMFADGISKMRGAVRDNNMHQANAYESHVNTLEEVMQLPGLLIDEQNADKEKEPQ